MGAFLFLALSAAISAHAYRPTDLNILRECQWNQKFLSTRVDCNDLYHHYPPKSASPQKKSPNERLKIASFNAYRLGSAQTLFKDYSIVAKMLNRWDLIALSEMHPNQGDQLAFNLNLVKAMEAGTISQDQAEKAYIPPGYLQLLRKLQSVDPSWGLIVSPVGQSSIYELYGFLYRASKLAPSRSNYCQGYFNDLSQSGEFTAGLDLDQSSGQRSFFSPQGSPVACLLRFRDQPFAVEHFSKIPFLGSFEYRRQRISMISLHLRYRTPSFENDEANAVCGEGCKDLLGRMMQTLLPETRGLPWIDETLLHRLVRKLPLSDRQKNLPEVQSARRFPDEVLQLRLDHTPLKDEASRFFEVFATVNELKIVEAEDRAPTVIAGDFNLEYFDDSPNLTKKKAKARRLWQRALSAVPDMQVVLSEKVKTSISTKSGLYSNFDHFLLSPLAASVCHPATAASYDFLTKVNLKWTASERELLKKRKFEELEKTEAVDADLNLKPLGQIAAGGTFRNCYNGQMETGSWLQKHHMTYQCQVFYETFDSPPRTRRPYRVYTSLISDHLPILMNCF